MVCSLVSMFQYLALNLAYQKNLHKTLGYWSRDMLNFNFSEEDLGLVSPSYFVYEFSRKMFLILHCINWPNFIVWLPLILKILSSMCIMRHYCTFVPLPSRVKVRVTVKLSATFFHDESSITKGGRVNKKLTKKSIEREFS